MTIPVSGDAKSKIEVSHPITLRMALALFFILHCVIHYYFCFFEYLGEPDAGRLVIDAIIIASEGENSLTGYRIRSSPAYICAIAFMLKKGMVTINTIPSLLTWVSLLSGGFVVAMGIAITYRWFQSYCAILVFVLIIEFCPVFWQSSIVGFPTMVALAFFMAALYLFETSLNEIEIRTGPLICSSLFFIAAVLLKIDVLALVPALFGIAYHHRRKKLASISVFILITAVIAFVLGSIFASHFSAPMPSIDFWQNWDSRWPMTLQTLFSSQAIGRLICGAGFLTVPLGAIALTSMALKNASYRRLSIMLILWVLPALIFWLSRPGGARHFISIYIPLAISISYLATLKPNQTKMLATIFLILFINYFAFKASADTLRPSGQIIVSSHLYRSELDHRHQIGNTIASNLTRGDVVIHGLGEYSPYLLFEAFKRSIYQLPSRVPRSSPTTRPLPGQVYRIYQAGGSTSHFCISYRSLSQKEVNDLKLRGVHIVSTMEKSSPMR